MNKAFVLACLAVACCVLAVSVACGGGPAATNLAPLTAAQTPIPNASTSTTPPSAPAPAPPAPAPPNPPSPAAPSPPAPPPPTPAPPSPPSPPPQPPAPTPNGIPQFTHVVLVVEENHSSERVIGNPVMPYLNRLADQNGLATQCYANTHPSIGNYFMLTAGQIITNDDSFTGTVSANNLVRILNANGKSWKSYAESLPSTGYLGGDIFPYIKRHNPFAFFSDVLTTAQASRIVPSWQLANDISSGQLPQFAFVAPNAEHDGHDCPGGGDSCSDDVKLGALDAWLLQNIGPLLSNSEFQQNGLLIVVFDEADDSDSAGGGGHIAMVVVSGKAKVGYRSTTRYQHQSTLRLILQAIGLTELPGAAASAPDMSEFF